MKKLTVLAIIGFLGLFAASKAEAQHYPSRVLSICPVCHQGVYAVYRPVNYHGCVRYAWVPVYHTTCMAHRHSVAVPTHGTRYITKYHRGVPYNYVVPSRVISPYGRGHGCSSGYSGYLRPGFSITIRR